MDYKISLRVIRLIVEEINKKDYVTSSDIEYLPPVKEFCVTNDCSLGWVIEELIEREWIENYWPIANSQLEVFHQENYWRLTDEARQFFGIRIRKVTGTVSKESKTLTQAFEERAKSRGRRGQPKFRKDLLHLYQSRCMISDCGIEQALEAAHIEPYCFKQCNDKENGLLLRADIHTLFDVALIAINPVNLGVIISKELRYSEYLKFMDSTIVPHRNLNCGNLKANLAKHFDFFNKEEEKR